MKDKFFKFFEIGKLDKGLFRIWLILLIPYFIFGYLYIKDSNTFYKNFDYDEERVTVANNYYCKLLRVKKYIDATNDEYIIRYGISSYSWVLNNNTHSTLEECLLETNIKKIKETKERIFIYLIFIILPIILAFIFLIIKKTFLWVYRGFK